MLGMSSPQLTNSIIFPYGVGQPLNHQPVAVLNVQVGIFSAWTAWMPLYAFGSTSQRVGRCSGDQPWKRGHFPQWDDEMGAAGIIIDT